MANGNRLALIPCILRRQLQLAADCPPFLDIIEKRNVAETRSDSCRLRRMVSHGSGGGTAVDEEEMMRPENRHELGHQLRVRCSERSLMVVDPNRVRHA